MLSLKIILSLKLSSVIKIVPIGHGGDGYCKSVLYYVRSTDGWDKVLGYLSVSVSIGVYCSLGCKLFIAY